MSTPNDLTKSAHAATPWRILDKDAYCYHVVSADASFQTGCITFDGRGLANAEFIVRACNAHDELVKAAQQAAAFLDTVEWNDNHSESEGTNAQHALEAALAKADGK